MPWAHKVLDISKHQAHKSQTPDAPCPPEKILNSRPLSNLQGTVRSAISGQKIKLKLDRDKEDKRLVSHARPASQCIPHTSPEAAQTGLPGSCLVPLHQKPEGKQVPRVMGY